MLFREIIGQDQVKSNLIDLISNHRLSHALLFLGAEGAGALPLAITFAQMVSLLPVLESNKGESPFDATHLGATSSNFSTNAEERIQQVDQWMQQQAGYPRAAALIHPDIHFSYPVIPKKAGDKPLSTDFILEWRDFVSRNPYGNIYDWLQFIGAENKQGNITAYECTEILRKLSLKSFESRFKILVMWMPEYLGNEGNKLLKLIEEPPEDTLFVLVAENESLILPTIRSRVQLIKIPVLQQEDLERALIDRSLAAADQARQIASVSEGNFREALQLLDHAGENWESLLRDWLNCILKSGPAAQVKWVEEISKAGRENQKQFLRYFIHLLEQSLRMRVLGSDHVHARENEKDFALRLNKIADLAQQQAVVNLLEKAIFHIERNANSKMLFQALTIKLYHILANNQLTLIS